MLQCRVGVATGFRLSIDEILAIDLNVLCTRHCHVRKYLMPLATPAHFCAYCRNLVCDLPGKDWDEKISILRVAIVFPRTLIAYH